MPRRIALLLLLVLFVVTMIGCGARYGDLKGMKIYVTAGPEEVARNSSRYFAPGELYTDSPKEPGDFFHPKDITIAFDKVWFCERETYNQLVADEANEPNADGDLLFIADRGSLASGDFYKPIDGFTAITASTSVPFTPTTLPSYGTTYYGVVVDVVHYECEMEDFSVRWYVQDHGGYLARDVVLKGPTTDGTWKFPYFRRATDGSLSFALYDTRQEVSAGTYLKKDLAEGGDVVRYFSITPDGLHDGEGGQGDAWEHLLRPMLLAGHATPTNPNPLDNPDRIEIFDEDENEAQYYLLQLYLDMNSDFAIGRINGFSMSPGITTGLTETTELTYTEFVGIIEENLTGNEGLRDPLGDFSVGEDDWIYTSVVTIGNGIDTRFGWMDFENNPQGGFSPEAGW